MRAFARGFLAFALSCGIPAPVGIGAQAVTFTRYDSALIRSGDVVFRRGRSVISDVVVAAESEFRYSHAGVAHVDESGVWVIHAEPDDALGLRGSVKRVPLHEYLSAQSASGAALYREPSGTHGAKASAAAVAFFEEGRTFDAGFALSTDDALYCTELVWKAYLAAGVDVTRGGRASLTFPVGQPPYILPGTLAASGGLVAVPGFAREDAE